MFRGRRFQAKKRPDLMVRRIERKHMVKYNWQKVEEQENKSYSTSWSYSNQLDKKLYMYLFSLNIYIYFQRVLTSSN